jgi:hypothetical protein
LGISSGHDGSTLKVGAPWAAPRAWPPARVPNTVNASAHVSVAVQILLAWEFRMCRLSAGSNKTDSISRAVEPAGQ